MCIFFISNIPFSKRRLTQLLLLCTKTMCFLAHPQALFASKCSPDACYLQRTHQHLGTGCPKDPVKQEQISSEGKVGSSVSSVLSAASSTPAVCWEDAEMTKTQPLSPRVSWSSKTNTDTGQGQAEKGCEAESCWRRDLGDVGWEALKAQPALCRRKGATRPGTSTNTLRRTQQPGGLVPSSTYHHKGRFFPLGQV